MATIFSTTNLYAVNGAQSFGVSGSYTSNVDLRIGLLNGVPSGTPTVTGSGLVAQISSSAYYVILFLNDTLTVSSGTLNVMNYAAININAL